MGQQLTPGSTFPALKLKIAGGEDLALPENLNSTYSIVLFYRGHW